MAEVAIPEQALQPLEGDVGRGWAATLAGQTERVGRPTAGSRDVPEVRPTTSPTAESRGTTAAKRAVLDLVLSGATMARAARPWRLFDLAVVGSCGGFPIHPGTGRQLWPI